METSELTLLLEVGNEIGFGTEAMLQFLRLKNLVIWALLPNVEVWLNHTLTWLQTLANATTESRLIRAMFKTTVLNSKSY